LTSSRHWKEKIVILGDLTFDTRVEPSNYTIILLYGRITLDNGADTQVFYLKEKSHIDIIGGVIEGNKANQASGDIIYVSGCDHIYISIEIYNAYRYGIGTVSTYGINEYVTIENSVIDGAGDYGIYFGCRYSVIEKCLIKDTGDSGIMAGETNEEMYGVICGNHIINAGNGTNDDGIKLVGHYYKIYGNTFENCGRDGIDVYGAVGAKIFGNDFINNGHNGGGNGVHITGGSKHCTVYNNDINGSYDAGIEITGSVVECYDIKVLGNTLLENKYGIHGSGPDYECIIESNIVINSTYSGIYFINGYNFTISENIVKNSGYGQGAPTYHGIQLHHVGYSTISDNRCFDDQGTKTQKFGIGETGTSDYNLIEDNYLLGNDDYGLNVSGINTRINHNMGTISAPNDLVNAYPVHVGYFCRANADETPTGLRIDAANKEGYYLGQVPNWITKGLRIEVWGTAMSANTTMHLNATIWAAGDNEHYQTHTVTLENQDSATSGFANNDMIYWSLTDSVINAISGGDYIRVGLSYGTEGSSTEAPTAAEFVFVVFYGV